MSILNIRPAVFGGSKAILGIAGVSGSGKTLTALLIARGMVAKASEVGFLDTENQRGSFYANKLDGQFKIADLYPPFSPARYATAIKEFQDAGVKVLVIDSVTHEWEGEGGCDDIANAPKSDGTDRKVANWNGAKREHRRFMNVLLQANMHIICCIRAREKVKIEKDSKGKDVFVPQGLQPVCEKNFMFEMTASLLMENEGKKQTVLKIPYFLKDAFGNGDNYLGQNTGKKIIEWLSTGEKEDAEVTKYKSELLMACESGIAGLTALWNTLTPKQQTKLKPHFGVYKEAAKAYDLQAQEADEDPAETLRRTQNMSQQELAMP